MQNNQNNAIVSTPGQPPNGDGEWVDFSGLYAKALIHDHPGIPNKVAYNGFISELTRGNATADRPIKQPLLEPTAADPAHGIVEVPNLIGGTNKLNGPQGAFLVQPTGGQSLTYPTSNPPKVGSPEYAVELIELYWASLLRDVAFTLYDGHPIVEMAVADLNRPDVLSRYRGPVDANTGKVTARLLFRGGPLPKGTNPVKIYFQGEDLGPYLSQLCLVSTSMGAQKISQKISTLKAGKDFMTDPDEWYRVQQGKAPTESLLLDPTHQHMRRGRDLAAFTHVDELYQAYFVAFLVMANSWNVQSNPGLPYGTYQSQKAFGTLGGPDVTGVLGMVARAAINAVWYQKWVRHLRHRPEAGAGLVHLLKSGATPLPQATAAFDQSILDLLQPVLTESANQYSLPGGPKTFLLSQAFPEGSPTHPAYPTGHGTVAGACITALKFFFDCSGHVSNYGQVVEPVEDGLGLRPYGGPDAGQMTVNGELHKLAHNISFGHGIHGGIHWRSDTDESILLGEAVALSVLRSLVKQYSEMINVTITSCRGEAEQIKN